MLRFENAQIFFLGKEKWRNLWRNGLLQVWDGRSAHEPRGERAAEHAAGDAQARVAPAELGVGVQGAVRASRRALQAHSNSLLRDDAAAGSVPASAVRAAHAVHGGGRAHERNVLPSLRPRGQRHLQPSHCGQLHAQLGLARSDGE